MTEASKFARESFDRTLETGAETVRGIQEGFTSALENGRDLNVRLIGKCGFRLCARSCRNQGGVGFGPGLDNARDQTV